MTVYDIVVIKFPDATNNAAATQLAIDEVEQVIKSYCNIDTVPTELQYTWANMAVDLVKYELTVNNTVDSVENIGIDEVSAIKVGDTNITLGAGSGNNQKAVAKSSHRPSLDDLVMGYKDQLRKFRRMVW